MLAKSSSMRGSQALKRFPREVVTAPCLIVFKKCLDNTCRCMLWLLGCPGQELLDLMILMGPVHLRVIYEVDQRGNCWVSPWKFLQTDEWDPRSCTMKRTLFTLIHSAHIAHLWAFPVPINGRKAGTREAWAPGSAQVGSVGAGAQPRCKASQGHQGSVLQVGAGSHLVVSRMFVTFVESTTTGVLWALRAGLCYEDRYSWK